MTTLPAALLPRRMRRLASPGNATLVATGLLLGACGGGGDRDPVEPPVGTNVVAAPERSELASLGDTVRLTASVRDASGQPVTGTRVTWLSLDATVATVDTAGLVHAIANGDARIVAGAGATRDTVAIRVAQVAAALAVAADSVTMEPDDTLTVAGQASDARGNALAAGAIQWRSLDESVAVIDGAGTVTSAAAGRTLVVATAGARADTFAVRVLPRFSRLAVGGAFACSTDEDGVTWCWGNNAVGQLGIGSTGGASAGPVRVTGDLVFNQIYAGGGSVCGVTIGRGTWCWGSNATGQLGIGVGGAITPLRNAPTRMAVDVLWSTIAIDAFHACGHGEGTVYCWGSNSMGQLGREGAANVDFPTPAPVSGLVRPGDVTVGRLHSCTLAYDGVFCWGVNDSGQFGTGQTFTDTPVPVSAFSGRRLVFMEAGDAHTCGIELGALRCAGANRDGVLGTGNFEDSASPALVTGGLEFARFSSAGFATCGITNPGSRVYCWGDREPLFLEQDTATPTLVPLEAASRISVGHMLACATDVYGAVYCWGAGAPTPSRTPVRVRRTKVYAPTVA